MKSDNVVSMRMHIEKLNREPVLTEDKLEKYMQRLNTKVLCGMAEDAEVDILRYLIDYSGESRLCLGN